MELLSANRINQLKENIENTTGESYQNLSLGIEALQNGYGTGVSKEEQNKMIEIFENGTTEVLPDDGKVLSKVTVNVDVASSDSEVPSNAKFQVVAYNADGYPLEVSVCSEGDTTTPASAFTPNANYVSNFFKTIEKVNLPSTVTTIGAQGFQGLTKLREVTNWDNIETMGTEAFASCGLKHDHLPPKLTVIPYNGFSRCAMPLTKFPDGLTTIGGAAFQYVSSIMNIVELPKGLISIGAYAFYNNGFAIVSFSEVPASVQTIGAQAFKGACMGIIGSLTFKGKPESIAGDAFQGGTKVTDVYVPWAEGEVANAPWGMTNATIHYNTTFDENGNRIEMEE